MSTEQDAGKNGKKLFSIITLAGFVILAAGYWLISWLHHDNTAADSAVNLNGATSSAGTLTTETPRYRELLKDSNDKGAADAARNNSSFIASLPVGLDSSEPPADKRPQTQPSPPPVQPPITGRQDVSSAAAQQASEKRKESLQKLLVRISQAHGVGGAPVQARMINEKSGATRESMLQASITPASLTTASQDVQQFIPALTRVPAYMETAIDSDNTTSQVVAEIPTGKWAGARLHSSSVKLVGDGVEVHFTKMSWQGMSFNVDAYAQRDDNLMSSVASDVNHRWGTHILLPSVLGGVGNIGGLYKDANTQILQTNFSSVTGHVGTPSAGTVAGVIAGGAAQKGADVVSQSLASEPYRQVTVKQHEAISILFVNAVTSNDIAGAKGAGQTVAAESAAPTAEQISEKRLQDAIARRQAEIRQTYGSN